MRIGTAAIAVAGTLLFAASQAAYAAPPMSLKDAVGSSPGLVELAGKGGGKGFGGRGFSGRSFSGRGYSGRGFSGGRGYAGKSFKGGSWARSGGNRIYAGKGYGKYGNYAWKGHNKGHYYRRGRYIYPYLWTGLAVGSYGYGNCGWERRQAQLTGDPYWWQRYQDCLYYY